MEGNTLSHDYLWMIFVPLALLLIVCFRIRYEGNEFFYNGLLKNLHPVLKNFAANPLMFC